MPALVLSRSSLTIAAVIIFKKVLSGKREKKAARRVTGRPVNFRN
jgi:hypothetical protein